MRFPVARLLPLLLCGAVLLAACAASPASSASTPSAAGTGASSTPAPPPADVPEPPPPETSAPAESPLPDGFVYVADVIPDVLLDIRYYGTNNFMGARADGYEAPVAILTEEAATALGAAADDLRAEGYVLKIFDSYRPASAVEHFARWAADGQDTGNRDAFYPGLDKAELFNLGYLATRSGHSRGSTVDLTLVSQQTGAEVDMGSSFDFFGPASHLGSGLATAEQAASRQALSEAMERHGFYPYEYEWWHFVLEDEPYPDTYFDFPVA